MAAEKKIVVTATHRGYLGRLREPGDVFEVTEAQFASRWMVRGSATLKRSAPDPARAARQEALAAGGPSAALTTALADLRDAAEREAALQARVSELEAALAARDLEAPVEEAAAEEAAAEEAATEEAATEEAPAEQAEPVRRVRRTAPQQ